MIWAGLTVSGDDSLDLNRFRITELDISVELDTRSWSQNNCSALQQQFPNFWGKDILPPKSPDLNPMDFPI
uniref:DDE_3 domain-containing protein n=1 Tax=Heterorhabditis bacteriophora TaxID=37862 RepID=A0A1I7WJ73_HETBA